MSYFKNLLSGFLRISASNVFKLPFNAENAEIRRERRETGTDVPVRDAKDMQTGTKLPWSRLRAGLIMPNMQDDGLVVQLHELVREHPDFEVLSAPTPYLYRFRYVPNGIAERQDEPEVQILLDRLNQEIVENVQRHGLTLVNTRVRGRVAIQMSICSRRTLADEVDAMFEIIARWGRLLNKTLSVRYPAVMEATLCSSESHSSPTEVLAT